MTTPSEEEARPYTPSEIEVLCRYQEWAGGSSSDDVRRAEFYRWLNAHDAALASRVSTPPAEDSEWVTAPDGEEFRRGACQGHACCTAKVHEHGCFADHDGTRCDHPEEHPAPTEPEERR